MERNELPVGFGIALAKNAEAMQRFANLMDSEKQEIQNQTDKCFMNGGKGWQTD